MFDLFGQAKQLQQASRWDEAAALYRQILDVAPDQNDVLLELAQVECKRGRPAIAAEYLQRLVLLQPTHAQARHDLGVALLHAGQHDKALAQMREAVRLHPQSLEIQNNLGGVLESLGRLSEAAESYQRATALAPAAPVPHFNLGDVLRRLGQSDAALDALRAAATLDPNLQEAWMALGTTLLASGQPAAALGCLRRAVSLRPRDAAALSEYKQALAHPAVNIAYQQLGQQLFDSGRTRELRALMDDWMRGCPDNPMALHMQAAWTQHNTPPRAANAYIRGLFDEFAAGFDEKLAKLEYRAPAFVTDIVSHFRAETSEPLTILDAGCGTGLCGELLRPLACHLIGVDLSTKMLDRARLRNVYDELVEAELTEYLGQSANRFDVIVSADTLVYFGDLVPVLATASRALRSGGLLAFTIEHLPDDEGLDSRLQPHGRYCHAESYIRRIFTNSGLVLRALSRVTLRTEHGQPVAGLLVAGSKSSGPRLDAELSAADGGIQQDIGDSWPLIQRARDAQRSGRFDEAATCYQQALQQHPDPSFVLLQLARLEALRGQPAAAAQHLQQLLAQAPAHGQAHHDLALALVALGNTESALEQMREAARCEPESAEILNNLGGLFEQLGRPDEALVAFRRAVALAPGHAVPQFNLGDALRKASQWEESITVLRVAVTLDPALSEAWAALGSALLTSGQPAAALGALRRANELRSHDETVCRQLGDALQALNQFPEAISWYERAAASNPTSLDTWYGLGRARLECDRMADAIEALTHCIRIDERYAPAHHELGRALFQLGCVEQAVPRFQEAAKLGVEKVRRSALLNLALITPGSPADDNQSILEARQAWGRHFPSRPARRNEARPATDPLRIGYCSSFFDCPQWMKPVWTLINHHDRERFQIHLISDEPAERVRGGYRPHARDRFVDISGLSNEAAAERIADCGLDVLIDLNGYSELARLPMYSLRPAPILAGWFNMYATSGLDCFDYLIGDEYVIPESEEPFYSERILRVPFSYLTFEVDYRVPDVSPLPMSASGQFTFGCLASQYKITDQVIRTWSEILRRSLNSRLLLRNKSLARNEHRSHLRERFAACGISSDRLLLEGPVEHHQFLETYGRIDVALDPFPYSGGTTTTEALWQGVPVVTFDGDRWVSRTSLSLLKAAGLHEFVGRDLPEYIELCVHLANSPDAAGKLQGLRAGMRNRLKASSVCDGVGFARAMESLYLRICRQP